MSLLMPKNDMRASNSSRLCLAPTALDRILMSIGQNQQTQTFPSVKNQIKGA